MGKKTQETQDENHIQHPQEDQQYRIECKKKVQLWKPKNLQNLMPRQLRTNIDQTSRKVNVREWEHQNEEQK